MKKKIESKHKLIIVISVLVILIVALLIVISNLKENEEIEVGILPTEITEAENLLRYYNCQNIRITNGSDEPFEKDIYLTFGEDLWKGEKSNEGYFSNIISYITNILEYKSYRMIDSSRELVIAVITDKENNSIKATYINGETNYFAKEKTKQIANNYEETKTTQISIQSQKIQELIKNSWKAESVDFGTRESRYEGYDIYFDEGIEVKTLGGKVYNVIFTEKYNENIVNGLKVNSDKDTIEKNLGKPAFEDENVVGYKGENVYVFFSLNEVSVYRVENEYNTEKFLKIWQEFEEEKDARKFTNEITNLWQDYNEYIYDLNYIYLEYALRGIKVQFDVSSENGIVLFNNYKGSLENDLNLSNLTSENIPKQVYLHTDDDLVFLTEQKRAAECLTYTDDAYVDLIYDEYVDLEDVSFAFTGKQSKEFYLIYTMETDGIKDVKFVSKNRTYPNSELIRHKKIYTYGWLNDEQFVYSVKGEGIYYYNAKTRALRTLVSGKENYEIKKLEGATLYYDDTSLNLR